MLRGELIGRDYLTHPDWVQEFEAQRRRGRLVQAARLAKEAAPGQPAEGRRHAPPCRGVPGQEGVCMNANEHEPAPRDTRDVLLDAARAVLREVLTPPPAPAVAEVAVGGV